MTSLFENLPLPGFAPAPGRAERTPGRDAGAAGTAPTAPTAGTTGTGDDAGTRRPRTAGTAADRGADRPTGRPSMRDPESLLTGLNPEQREAVLHSGSPLLIVAGAGSGKTRVLTHRIAHLIATGRSRPGEILAITFTNKAAGEMRERVEALVGPSARMMWVSTFHSACVRILRKEAATLGLRTTFSIYDAADSQRLMTMVCRELDLDLKRYPPKALSARGSPRSRTSSSTPRPSPGRAVRRPAPRTTSTPSSPRPTPGTRSGCGRRTRWTSTTSS